MQFTLHWTPHRSVRHTCTRPGVFLRTAQAPLSGRGLDTSRPAYPRAQWWEMAPHSHTAKNMAKCVRPSTQNSFRDSLIPSHMLSTTDMLYFLYHFGNIFGSLHHAHVFSTDKGFSSTALFLCREAQRTSLSYQLRDVNHAGDRPALMGL